jgi:hypothetical protein
LREKAPRPAPGPKPAPDAKLLVDPATQGEANTAEKMSFMIAFPAMPLGSQLNHPTGIDFIYLASI